MKIDVHIILVCETFLKDYNVSLYNIPAYNMIYRDRCTSTRGGVCVYINDLFEFSEIDSSQLNYDTEFECVLVEVRRKIILGEIYRVPDTNESVSAERYDQLLVHFQDNYPGHDVLLDTDHNFDYVNVNVHQNTAKLVNVFSLQACCR